MNKTNMVSAFMEHTLQSSRKEQKFREVKELAQNHKARKAELGSQPRYPDSVPSTFDPSGSLEDANNQVTHGNVEAMATFFFLPKKKASWDVGEKGQMNLIILLAIWGEVLLFH